MAHPLISFLSILILALGIIFQFFVILSGAVNGPPVDSTYFLQASTSGIPNARDPSRWTFFSVCGVDGSNGKNINCGSIVPALPFSPPDRRNFGTTVGVPEAFLNTRHYYYLSRFMFVFVILSLLFAALAISTSLLALCTRIGAYITSVNTFIAFFFQTLAACLMTAWTVQGRNAFRRDGHDAHLGKQAYGFTWGAAACFFLATITFCMGGSSGHKKRVSYESTSSRRGFFRRGRSVRSRKEYV